MGGGEEVPGNGVEAETGEEQRTKRERRERGKRLTRDTWEVGENR